MPIVESREQVYGSGRPSAGSEVLVGEAPQVIPPGPTPGHENAVAQEERITHFVIEQARLALKKRDAEKAKATINETFAASTTLETQSQGDMDDGNRAKIKVLLAEMNERKAKPKVNETFVTSTTLDTQSQGDTDDGNRAEIEILLAEMNKSKAKHDKKLGQQEDTQLPQGKRRRGREKGKRSAASINTAQQGGGGYGGRGSNDRGQSKYTCFFCVQNGHMKKTCKYLAFDASKGRCTFGMGGAIIAKSGTTLGAYIAGGLRKELFRIEGIPESLMEWNDIPEIAQ
jgi:hypothetical protein